MVHSHKMLKIEGTMHDKDKQIRASRYRPASLHSMAKGDVYVLY